MIRHFKPIAAVVLFLGLLAANLGVASAHNWSSWHWNKSGPAITIRQWNYASNSAAAEAARVDAWNKIGILYNYSSNAHTDVSVFDGYWDTNWAGLASIESSSWDWGCFWFCHVTHGHARYNTKYPGSQSWIQGVFCQEVFHTYGFDHSNTGDCMGLGYYNNVTVLGPHNNTDFYNRYRNH